MFLLILLASLIGDVAAGLRHESRQPFSLGPSPASVVSPAPAPAFAGSPAPGPWSVTLPMPMIPVIPVVALGSLPLNIVVLNRAAQELAVARSAEASSEASASESLVTQQELVADMALEPAEEAAEKGLESVAGGKVAVGKARKYMMEAQLHADHVKQMEAKLEGLPAIAAQMAAQAIEKEVKVEAYRTAEIAGNAPPESPADHTKKVAARVAAAVEPYHLALLRAQKYAAVTYARAKKVAEYANVLAQQSRDLAKKAQGDKITLSNTLDPSQLQGLPQGPTLHVMLPSHPVLLKAQAHELMDEARKTMREAASMKAQAETLYARASIITNSLPNYQLAERRAAASAVGTIGVPVLPMLPAMPTAAPPMLPPMVA